MVLPYWIFAIWMRFIPIWGLVALIYLLATVLKHAAGYKKEQQNLEANHTE